MRQQSFLANGMAVIWAMTLADLLFHIYFNNHERGVFWRWDGRLFL